jgi:hypothetical protein
MADDGFTYVTAIKDLMSDPAHTQAAALGSLDAALKKDEAALKSHGDAHGEAGKHVKEHEGFLKSFTSSLVPEIAVGELAAEGIKKIGESFVELGESIVEFGIEGVKFALESAEFRENMVEAFTITQGTAEEGEEVYNTISRLADAHHLDIGKSEGLAKELALSGVENVGQLASTVTAIGSLQRVGLEAGAEKVRRLIEQSEAAGHLVLPKKLGAVGFSLADLAKGLGETPKQLALDLKAGKITVEQGIRAIDEAINNGKVGQLAAKKFDLKDVATDWANVWRNLTEDVDSGPLVSALRNFVAIFDDGSASGAGMKEEIVSDVNTIIRYLGTGVEDVETFALEIELGFLKGKNAARPLVNEIESLSVSLPTMQALGADVEWVAENLTTAAIRAAYLVTELAKLQHWLGGEAAQALHAGGFASAEDFVGGLAEGIGGGTGLVVGAIRHLGTAGIEALREVWDSHSPSRVAMGVGEGIGEGVAIGADSSSGRAATAIGNVFAPPDFAGIGGGTGPSLTIAAGALQVNISGATGNADAIKEVAEEAFADLLERISLELGG